MAKAGSTVALDLLANDFNLTPNGAKLTLVSSSQPNLGSASIQKNRLTYTAPAHVNGSTPVQATLSYTASNGDRNASSTVDIGVEP